MRTHEYLLGPPFFDAFAVSPESVFPEFLGREVDFFLVELVVEIGVLHLPVVEVEDPLFFLHQTINILKYCISIY